MVEYCYETIKKFCNFVHSFHEITWTRTTRIICMLPVILIIGLITSLILLTGDHNGAVVSDSIACANVGKNILKEGGSAVDAAIAMLLCEGVTLPSSAGLGGGLAAVIYTNGRLNSIVAGPAVPAAVAKKPNLQSTDLHGAKAVGVPGELLAYWEMHKRYGSLPWKRLFQPSIELCKTGAPMSHWMASVIRHTVDRIEKSKTMSQLFPQNLRDHIFGMAKLKFPKLAKTLEILAEQGASAFYNGTLGRDFVADIQAYDGYITMKDLQAYKVIWNDDLPFTRLFGRYKVVTTPLPTYGVATILILNILKNLPNPPERAQFWHRYIEATKHAYGHSTKLGDPTVDADFRARIMENYNKMLNPDFARELRQLINDSRTFDDPLYYGASNELNFGRGSANVCVLSPNGDVVTVTTSLLEHFGSFFASNRTGIIANNLLKTFVNFDIGPVQIMPANRPIAGRQAFLPYSPAIVFNDKLKPHLVLSASGDAEAATIVSTAIIKYVWFGRPAGVSIYPAYLHNQLFPNVIRYHRGVPRDIVYYLRQIGHRIARKIVSFDNYTSALCIGMRNMVPESEFDPVVGGSKAQLLPTNSSFGFMVILMIFCLTFFLLSVLVYQILCKNAPIVGSSTA